MDEYETRLALSNLGDDLLDCAASEFGPITDKMRELLDIQSDPDRALALVRHPEFVRELEHAIEQAGKEQWWNVIASLNRAEHRAIKEFDSVLKKSLTP